MSTSNRRNVRQALNQSSSRLATRGIVALTVVVLGVVIVVSLLMVTTHSGNHRVTLLATPTPFHILPPPLSGGQGQPPVYGPTVPQPTPAAPVPMIPITTAVEQLADWDLTPSGAGDLNFFCYSASQASCQQLADRARQEVSGTLEVFFLDRGKYPKILPEIAQMFGAGTIGPLGVTSEPGDLPMIDTVNSRGGIQVFGKVTPDNLRDDLLQGLTATTAPLLVIPVPTGQQS